MIDLDIGKPIWMYDDRAKSDDLMKVTKILWQDGTHALFVVDYLVYDDKNPLDQSKWKPMRNDDDDQPILVSLDDQNVMNKDFDSWMVTNDISWWRPFGWDGD